MIYKIQGEQPFQVLASNFSIGPSNEGYTLQISADGNNYSDLFSVGANVTRMVTGVANGSFYRLSGNNSLVQVNWNKQCNDGGSGGGEYILPVASETILGGIKVGDGLTINASTGVLSVDGAPQLEVQCPDAQLIANLIVGEASGVTYLCDASGNRLSEFIPTSETAMSAEGDFPAGLYRIEVEAYWEEDYYHFWMDCEGDTGIYVKANAFSEPEIGLYEDPETGDVTMDILWNEVSPAGGDSHVLLASSATPAGLQDGDVFAGTQFGIKQKQGQADVWVAFVANEFEYVREDIGNDDVYLMHWDNDSLFKGVEISGGEFSQNQGYGMSMGADGKMHCTDPDYPNITAWIEGGKLYWNNPYGVISMLDAYQAGSNLQGCSGQTDVYSNAVMSQQVTKIWKGNASEYAALGGNVSEDTLYIII